MSFYQAIDSKIRDVSVDNTPVDFYSLTHITWGILIGLGLQNIDKIPGINIKLTKFQILFWSAIISILFELSENTIIKKLWNRTIEYEGDSVLNSQMDNLFIILGVYLSFIGSKMILLCIVVIVEIVLLFLIRDNITLLLFQTIFANEKLSKWQEDAPIPYVTPISVAWLKSLRSPK